MAITTEDLDRLVYLPVLRSRQAELRGYERLRPATKAGIIPVISLGNLGKIRESSRVLEAVNERVGRAFVDLNLYSSQACDDVERLINPDNHYEAWRECIRNAGENILPVPILIENAPLRDFVRQVSLIEQDFGVVVLRSRNPIRDHRKLETAISAVDDPDNVFVVLDFGYIRGSQEAHEVEAVRLINSLRTMAPSLRIAIQSSSYPRSIAAHGQEAGALDVLEREFHERLGGDEVAIYGDHGSIHSEPFEPAMARFVPRIDYPTGFEWIFRRHRADQGGYSQCAREITELPEWDPEAVREMWGAQCIQDAAVSPEVPAGFGSPAPWIGVRVNLHLERQWEISSRTDEDDGEW